MVLCLTPFQTFDEAKTQCPETVRLHFWSSQSEIRKRLTRSFLFAQANTVAPEGYGCSVANILSKAGPIMQKQVRGAPSSSVLVLGRQALIALKTRSTGSWLDLDMLEVGRGGMTTDEYIVHFSMVRLSLVDCEDRRLTRTF